MTERKSVDTYIKKSTTSMYEDAKKNKRICIKSQWLMYSQIFRNTKY
jgi:hypothetical protein